MYDICCILTITEKYLIVFFNIVSYRLDTFFFNYTFCLLNSSLSLNTKHHISVIVKTQFNLGSMSASVGDICLELTC